MGDLGHFLHIRSSWMWLLSVSLPQQVCYDRLTHTRESDFRANDAFRDCVVGQERGQLDLCQKQERARVIQTCNSASNEELALSSSSGKKYAFIRCKRQETTLILCVYLHENGMDFFLQNKSLRFSTSDVG